MKTGEEGDRNLGFITLVWNATIWKAQQNNTADKGHCGVFNKKGVSLTAAPA